MATPDGPDLAARARDLLDDARVAEAAIDTAAATLFRLGGDVARRTRYIAYGGMPGLAYLGDRYLPRLREAVGDDAVHRMLVTTPARFLALHS